MLIRKPYSLPNVFIALMVLGLFLGGMQSLTVPKIFLLVQSPHPFFAYQGPLLIGLAILLAWFHTSAATRLQWLFTEAHRWITALLCALAIGMDGSLHLLNIPHMEGWWFPLLGGGAVAAILPTWIDNLRHKACLHRGMAKESNELHPAPQEGGI